MTTFTRQPRLSFRSFFKLVEASPNHFASVLRELFPDSDSSSSRCAVLARMREGGRTFKWFANMPINDDATQKPSLYTSYAASKCSHTTLNGRLSQTAISKMTVLRRRSISAAANTSFVRRMAPCAILLTSSTLSPNVLNSGLSHTHSILTNACSTSLPRLFRVARSCFRLAASTPALRSASPPLAMTLFLSSNILDSTRIPLLSELGFTPSCGIEAPSVP